MAPVRRYLRISKYSVLECRIYLDNPSLAQSWLLNPRNPALTRIVESIRPLVLPKLREERERSRKKSSKKKKTIKDVITQDDFEISMFLTETSTRHSLLTKQKHFRERGPQMMQSNSTELISETNHIPIDVDGQAEPETAAIVREESSDDDDNVRLLNVPATRPKRHRSDNHYATHVGDSKDEDSNSAIDLDSDAEQPATKRVRLPGALDADGNDPDGEDDKKKLAMDVSYEGFAIYGRVLCLVVRRRENKTQRLRQDSTAPEGQANMENWITSTQIPVGEDIP